ncbi:MAG: ABC transporter ATP-binding protein [Bacilli bacterium]|nr:ABC transporter ATP-binding protein [Bacilli bacterium]
MMELIEFRNLSKNYGAKQALIDINLKIEKGKIYGLLGPNGSGKTTLIKIINDLLQPSSGEILVKGKEPGIESKKIISYLPERTYLNMNMKVSELIQFFKDFYQDFDEKKALKLLNKLKINENDKLKNMSKGTKEKVQLVMVMSRKADLYILDEPIGGVDPASRDYILDTILTNFNEGSSIIICTHLIADIEKILDQVIFINQGKIVLNEDADTIRKKKKTTIDKLFREEFKC